ncbi:MAG: AAA family ATPase [Planctomycetaceae bacterium]|jgi:hypothetical protein|nr:AAA family ATPase [Planctomycetaceae bacterium]
MSFNNVNGNEERFLKYIPTLPEPRKGEGGVGLLRFVNAAYGFGLAYERADELLRAHQEPRFSYKWDFSDEEHAENWKHTLEKAYQKNDKPFGYIVKQTRVPIDSLKTTPVAETKRIPRIERGEPSELGNVLADSEISLFISCRQTTPDNPISIAAFLEGIRDGTWSKSVESVRNAADETLRASLKKALIAVTIQSEVCEQRNKESCRNNGFLCLDFDHIAPEKIEQVKRDIAALPYVAAVWKSAGGQGLAALCRLAEPTYHLGDCIKAMQSGFPDSLIDKACSDVSRLRFVSYDPEIIVKDECRPAILRYETEAIHVTHAEGAEGLSKPKRSASMQQSIDRRKEEDEKKQSAETEVITKPFSEYEQEAVEWLLKDVIPLKGITILYGKPGQGKSFFTCWLAAAVSGEDVIDFRGAPIPKGDVIMLNAEDNPNNTIKPRLAANDAGMNRVHNVLCVRRVKAGGEDYDYEISLDKPRDFQVLLNEKPDCKLVIIDPVSTYWGEIGENKNADIRFAMKQLKQIAETHGIAIVIVTHTNKGNGTDSSARIMGSRGLDGAARSVFLVSEDAETGLHTVSFHKNNISESKYGFTFTIQDKKIGIEEQYHKGTADDVFQKEAESRIVGRRPSEKFEETKNWLEEFLGDDRKPVGDKDEPAEGTIRYEAERNDYSWSTVKRAKKSLGIIAKKDGIVWFWYLPNLSELTNKGDHDSISPQEPDVSLGPLLFQ